MGSGASKNRVKRYDSIQQLPTIDPLRQQPSSQSTHPPHSAPTLPPQAETKPHAQHSQRKPKKQQEPDWPVPPDEYDDIFDPEWSLDEQRYSLQRAYAAKIATCKLEMPATTSNREHHQKDTNTTRSNEENSRIIDSAHVQSTLSSQSHACYNLSTTDEVDELMVKLNYAHVKLDDIVKRRLDIISKETEAIIERIATDTYDAQQRLLLFSKVRQTRQDTLYREWLQMYIAVLNEWKSLQLAKLQEELCMYQKQIIIESQRRISSINKAANRMKEQILKEEQAKATQEINGLIAQIEALSSKQTLQHLGSETMTRINLTIQANVGKKAPGQNCTFDFGQNGSTGGQKNGATAQPVKTIPPKPSASGTLKSVSTNTKTKTTIQPTTVYEDPQEDEDEP